MAKRKAKVTKYNKLQKAAAADCKSGTKSTAAALKKAKADYINHAVKNGKTTTEAKKIAAKASGCNPFKKKK